MFSKIQHKAKVIQNTALLVAGTLLVTPSANADELAPLFSPPKAKQEAPAKAEVPLSQQSMPAPVMMSADPQAHLMAPDSRAAMRINPEAPGPFIGLADSYFRGDAGMAKAYAKQFVRYLSDLTFAVKDITRLIGDALIEEGKINEEDWNGVEQFLDYQMAQARSDSGSPFKTTQEDALRRIASDPKGEVEVYYFFTLNSSHARKMSADVERLWRFTKTDPRIKMVALTLGTQEKAWIRSYRDYTGLTLPILDGSSVAKTLNVTFVPAVVVVTPNSPAAYLKTGQQSFKSMYEVVRKAQGESIELNQAAQKLKSVKIGAEKREETLRGGSVITASNVTVKLGSREALQKF